jgi:hypothetical protein
VRPGPVPEERRGGGTRGQRKREDPTPFSSRPSTGTRMVRLVVRRWEEGEGREEGGGGGGGGARGGIGLQPGGVHVLPLCVARGGYGPNRPPRRRCCVRRMWRWQRLLCLEGAWGVQSLGLGFPAGAVGVGMISLRERRRVPRLLVHAVGIGRARGRGGGREGRREGGREGTRHRVMDGRDRSGALGSCGGLGLRLELRLGSGLELTTTIKDEKRNARPSKCRKSWIAVVSYPVKGPPVAFLRVGSSLFSFFPMSLYALTFDDRSVRQFARLRLREAGVMP